VPGYGVQLELAQLGKHVLVPALFVMHQFVPGQSSEFEQYFVHHAPLHVPSEHCESLVHGEPIPPPEEQ
jgi:hypothetical protein